MIRSNSFDCPKKKYNVSLSRRFNKYFDVELQNLRRLVKRCWNKNGGHSCAVFQTERIRIHTQMHAALLKRQSARQPTTDFCSKFESAEYHEMTYSFSAEPYGMPAPACCIFVYVLIIKFGHTFDCIIVRQRKCPKQIAPNKNCTFWFELMQCQTENKFKRMNQTVVCARCSKIWAAQRCQHDIQNKNSKQFESSKWQTSICHMPANASTENQINVSVSHFNLFILAFECVCTVYTHELRCIRRPEINWIFDEHHHYITSRK